MEPIVVAGISTLFILVLAVLSYRMGKDAGYEHGYNHGEDVGFVEGYLQAKGVVNKEKQTNTIPSP